MLFKDAPDLMDEFKDFLPEAVPPIHPPGVVGILPQPTTGPGMPGSFAPPEPPAAEKSTKPQNKRSRKRPDPAPPPKAAGGRVSVRAAMSESDMDLRTHVRPRNGRRPRTTRKPNPRRRSSLRTKSRIPRNPSACTYIPFRLLCTNNPGCSPCLSVPRVLVPWAQLRHPRRMSYSSLTARRKLSKAAGRTRNS